MKNVRQSVFETNSSSSHSITISECTSGIYSTMNPDKKGNIVLEGGKFGWEYDVYYDPWTKANYCALDVCDDEKLTAMLVEVIKEHTGAKEVSFKLHGYIDHQSYGTSHEAFASKQTLKDFIFNSDSELMTDNDNH